MIETNVVLNDEMGRITLEGLIVFSRTDKKIYTVINITVSYSNVKMGH